PWRNPEPASAGRLVLCRASTHRGYDGLFLVRYLLLGPDALARGAEIGPLPGHRRQQRRSADGRSVSDTANVGQMVPQPAVRRYSQPDPQGVLPAPADLGD